MGNDTIRLLRGEITLGSRHEVEKFRKGDTIWGDNACPEELKKWNIQDKAEAQDWLAEYRCRYKIDYSTGDVVEYALEYFVEDEDGEFISGSDYDLAEDEEE